MLHRVKAMSLVPILKLRSLNASQCSHTDILVSTCMFSTVGTEIMGLKQKSAATTDVLNKGYTVFKKQF